MTQSNKDILKQVFKNSMLYWGQYLIIFNNTRRIKSIYGCTIQYKHVTLAVLLSWA